MATYTSSAALRAAIEARVPIALQIATEKIKKVIDDVLNQYYGEFNKPPRIYERTNQLLESVKIEVDGNIGRIYVDSSGWGHILGSWSEEDILYDAMLDGGHGRSPYATSHTPVWDTSLNRLGNIELILKKALIEAGIPVK